MREIIFDTETTGLDNKTDRIIEIGGIELFNHFPTGNTLHLYINPGNTKVHPDALAIHGITDEFLRDKPVFADVAEKIVSFFQGAKWIAHNANFDMGFINAELGRLGMPAVLPDQVIDTLALARRKNPMGPNSLDALCRRYGIDNSHRTKHGALLDSELLAEVYIEMIGGRQAALGLSQTGSSSRTAAGQDDDVVAGVRRRPHALPPRISIEEKTAHDALVASLGAKGLWQRYDA